MGVNLRDIKILIIEDDQEHFTLLKQALEELGVKEIFPKEFKEIHDTDTLFDLYDFYLELIKEKEIDVTFFDLALKSGEDASDGSGVELIQMFLNNDDDRVRFIIKIILSGATNTDKLNALVKQDVKLIIPKTGTNFKKLLVDNNLNSTLPEFVKLYREIKSFSHIKQELEDIKNKVSNIETITKIVAQALPQLTNKKQAKKLIANWEKNERFKQAMQKYFPNTIDSLFTSIKEKIEDIKANTTNNITEVILEQAKSYLEKEAEINEDDQKMVRFLKYSAYITEEIGRIIHS